MHESGNTCNADRLTSRREAIRNAAAIAAGASVAGLPFGSKARAARTHATSVKAAHRSLAEIDQTFGAVLRHAVERQRWDPSGKRDRNVVAIALTEPDMSYVIVLNRGAAGEVEAGSGHTPQAEAAAILNGDLLDRLMLGECDVAHALAGGSLRTVGERSLLSPLLALPVTHGDAYRKSLAGVSRRPSGS